MESPGRCGRETNGGSPTALLVALTTVVPATTSAEDILALNPDGVFLSNGPGDPAATGEYAVPVIRDMIDRSVPTFGICLGHQMLGIALGGRTVKMHQGHHGANHPVKDLTTGKVEITSTNHGFAVDKDSLPANVEQADFVSDDLWMVSEDDPAGPVTSVVSADPIGVQRLDGGRDAR